MFFKQYNYKPRSSSMSSQGSGSGVAGSPPKDESSKTTSTNTSAASETKGPAASAGAAGRRRSSAAEQFAGLQGLKRNTPGDERKASWAEQKPGQSGILGGMWNSFTKGSS